MESQPMRGRGLSWAQCATATVGVACYVVRHEPGAIFPLWYFTVLSALVLAVATALPPASAVARWLYWTAAPAVLLSAVGWWALTLPTMGMEPTALAWGAGLLLHLVLPALVMASAHLLATPRPPAPPKRYLTLLYPTGYFAVVLLAQGLQDVTAPYSYMDLDQTPIPVIAAVCLGQVAGYQVSSWVLLWLARRRTESPRS